MRPALVHKTARRTSGPVQAMRGDCLRAAPAVRGGKTRKIVAASDPGGLLYRILYYSIRARVRGGERMWGWFVSWFSQATPPVQAALVGGSVAAVVSLLVAIINQLSVRSMQKEKLDFDRELAERKVNADIALAEKKFALDQALASWKRRSDLAEQALINFYEARTILRRARLGRREEG